MTALGIAMVFLKTKMKKVKVNSKENQAKKNIKKKIGIV
jgi:hypothetical protein